MYFWVSQCFIVCVVLFVKLKVYKSQQVLPMCHSSAVSINTNIAEIHRCESLWETLSLVKWLHEKFWYLKTTVHLHQKCNVYYIEDGFIFVSNWKRFLRVGLIGSPQFHQLNWIWSGFCYILDCGGDCYNRMTKDIWMNLRNGSAMAPWKHSCWTLNKVA